MLSTFHFGLKNNFQLHLRAPTLTCYNYDMSSKLVTAAELIAKVVDGNDLSAVESERVFHDVFLYDTDGFHTTALISAIHAKGETAEELLGFVNVHKKLGARLSLNVPPEKVTDLSGTGGGKFKTFNVSTTASFIVAAAGYTVVKEAYYAITSPTGSADVFAAFGIDIFKLTPEKITTLLEKVRISPCYLPTISPKLANRSAINKRVLLEAGLRIKTPYHLASNTVSPVPMKLRIYGCYDKKYLRVIAEMFTKAGYEHTLTVYAADGFPEVSNLGKTHAVEQQGDSISEIVLTPDDFGVQTATPKDIATGGKEQNIIDFLKILHGKEMGAKRDLVLVNAAASLCVLGAAKDYKSGVKLAGELIDSGDTKELLEKFVKTGGDYDQYEAWLAKADL